MRTKTKFTYKKGILLGLISIIMSLSFNMDAKEIDSLSAFKLKRTAGKLEKNNEIYAAIDYFKHYLKKKPDDVKSMYHVAGLYFSVRDYKNSRNYYDSVIKYEAKKYALSYYYRGILSMNLEDYQASIESFSTFRKWYIGKKDPHHLRRMASTYIESAQWAMVHKDSLADVTINNLGEGINSRHIDFAPYPVNANTFLYGSFLPDTVNYSVRKIYVAGKSGNTWLKKGLLDGDINNSSLNTGNAALSFDGKRLYFTRCFKNWQNKDICNIYMSTLEDGNWSEPEKLPYPVNNDNNTSTQPALGINIKRGNDILYFVSDREGTRGGLDIWYTEYNKRKKEYKEPRNMGRSINTEVDECCPFIYKESGALYFSSKGKIGFGGYDIYKSVGSGRTWSDAEPLSMPINSSYDDTYFTTLNGTEGFFASNRPGSNLMEDGSCCEDIYAYKYNQCIMLPASGKVFNITNRDIYELLNEKYHQNLVYITDNAPLANIPVKLYAIDESTQQELFVNQTHTDKNGNYNFNLERNKNYVVVVENYGYFDKRISIRSHDYNCDETINLKETGINYLPEITVRFNIYYEHDKSRLTPEAREIIDTTLLPLFDLYPTALVEIGSHTDNTGSDNYNIKLSQRRSESVVRYLIEKGIDQDRLIAKGYGESQPIAPNKNPDGSDNPEGRQLNRRTEFKIVGSLNAFYHDEDL